MTTVGAILAYEPENIKPGWVALVLVLALAVATYLLWRSMNKQLGKIEVPTRQEIRDAQKGEPRHEETDGEPRHEETDGEPDDGLPPRS